MKTAEGKTKKQRTTAARTPKPVCGTLSYLSECRGAFLKTGLPQRPEPPADAVNRIVRKYSAEL